MRFRAELESTGKTTAGFEVPEDVVEGVGGGGHPKVTVTVDGFTFRTSIARMGGRFLLGVSAERRAQSGIETGQVFDVDVELDTEPREIEVPEDLAAALTADEAARKFWNTLSYSKQSWHVHQVTSAKKAETRAARVEKSVTMLRDGRAR
ncbi:YdeI/OmpD-associated family protein [Actinophytocola algeriensis]|uniref:DUF1905 domain-containing protein n=1 Tax=Actinophytocola algeriensis TaxID=1768010 RepID=A0A7W7Q812_9PSEU|nr:YdeI/OmpD-associated family protein [Actinophytocola algeriensis]MBB4908750.1 hypothetical protein [Actinophytocola algeriensis]MBE1474863.1 hypothetical protein [Actinophytocola algeriensis]